MTNAARFTITLSSRLNQDLEEVVVHDEDGKAAAIGKALHLYIASRKAIRQGNKVGIADPETDLRTEFINL